MPYRSQNSPNCTAWRLRAAWGGVRSAKNPLLECLSREGRHGTLGRDPGRQLERPARSEAVGEARQRGARPGDLVDEPEGVGVAGSHPAPIVVMEELGLVGRQVDSCGALARTALAGEAQIEGARHLGAAPTRPHDVALQHLEEEAGTATSRVHLVTGHGEAGTHDPAPGAG